MSILNQTTDVIKLELTKHGRKLLSHGVLKPSYYSFFDDSIIYDSSYFKILESGNDTQERILDKSIYLSSLNNTFDSLSEPLGASSIVNDYAPSWDLKILKGNITFLQQSSSYYKNIFNFDNIHYVASLGPDQNPQNPIILNDFILLDIKELNIFDESENFEIEIVTFDEISGNNNSYIRDGHKKTFERKLFFSKKRNNIIDDIIYDDDEISSQYYSVEINENDAEYYYDVLVDEEIDTEFIGLLTKDPVGSSFDINPTIVTPEAVAVVGARLPRSEPVSEFVPTISIENSGEPEC